LGGNAYRLNFVPEFEGYSTDVNAGQIGQVSFEGVANADTIPGKKLK
jgi:hypothetical protein